MPDMDINQMLDNLLSDPDMGEKISQAVSMLTGRWPANRRGRPGKRRRGRSRRMGGKRKPPRRGQESEHGPGWGISRHGNANEAEGRF